MTTRLLLASDLAATIAQAGVDPTLKGRALQDAILSAIADRRGYLNWDMDHADCVVFLHHPDQETFHGRTLEEAGVVPGVAHGAGVWDWSVPGLRC